MSEMKYSPGRVEIFFNKNSEELIETRFNGVDEWTVKIQSKQQTKIESRVGEKIEKPNIISKVDLPDVEEIIDYITTKQDFEHDNAELHEHFLGKKINSRSDRKTYFSFAVRISKAKEQIAQKYNGSWESLKKRDLGKRKRVKVFTFVKSNNQSNVTNQELRQLQ